MAVSRFRHAMISVLALCSMIHAHPMQPGAQQSRTADISSYTVPLSDGTASLPSPTATLKYITLGRGTQNYSCASVGVAPTAAGAKATLFDTSSLLARIPAPFGLQCVENLPRLAVNVPTTEIAQRYGMYQIGQHYFNSAGQPTFDLGKNGFLVAKKIGDIPAPSNATVGPENQPTQDYGAVDWLTLTDAGGSVALTEVYRVETAGGKPPATCTTTGLITQQYAALYWFYGPA